MYSKFYILNPTISLTAQEARIINKVEEFIKKYPNDLAKNLVSKLIQIKNVLYENLQRIDNIREFYDFIKKICC